MGRIDALWEAGQELNKTAWLAFGAWFEFSQEWRDQFVDQLDQANNILIHVNQDTAEKLRQYGGEYDEYLLGEDHAEGLVGHQESCAEQLDMRCPVSADFHENVGSYWNVDGHWLNVWEVFSFIFNDMENCLSSREIDILHLSVSLDNILNPLNECCRAIQFHPGGSQGGYFTVEPGDVKDWEVDEAVARFGEIFPEREAPVSVVDLYEIVLGGCGRDDEDLRRCLSRVNQDFHRKVRNLWEDPPRWNRENLELIMDGEVVARWTGRARGGPQFALLDELEALGWPRRMRCPFPLGMGMRRADDVVYRMNEKLRVQDDCRLDFHVSDKDDQGDFALITWQVTGSVAMS